MKTLKRFAIAASALAMVASPVMAAEAKVDQARAAAQVGQTEQLFDGEDNWLLFALIGVAAIVGLFVVLDDPASP